EESTAATPDPEPSTPAATSRGVLASILRGHPRMLAVVLPLAVLSEAAEMALPILLGMIIDRGIVAGDLAVTLIGAALLIGMRLVGMLLWIYTFVESQKACMYQRHRLRVGLTGAVLDPRSRRIRRPAGEVLSIATSDADKASDVLDM